MWNSAWSQYAHNEPGDKETHARILHMDLNLTQNGRKASVQTVASHHQLATNFEMQTDVCEESCETYFFHNNDVECEHQAIEVDPVACETHECLPERMWVVGAFWYLGRHKHGAPAKISGFFQNQAK